MKKLLAIVMVIAIMASVVAFSASAAGTYGDWEKKVIELLGTDVKIKVDGKDAILHIPDNYVNQAKNFFASSEGDITEAEYEEIAAYIKAGEEKVVEAVEADHSLVVNGQVDIAHMSKEVKTDVLEQGQKACEVVDLSLEYTSDKVVITTTDSDAKEVFSDEAIVKTTGAEVSVALGTALAMVALAAAAVFTAKKAELF